MCDLQGGYIARPISNSVQNFSGDYPWSETSKSGLSYGKKNVRNHAFYMGDLLIAFVCDFTVPQLFVNILFVL